MKKLTILIVVLFLAITVMPGFCQGELSKISCRTELGKNVFLTNNVNAKYINLINNDIERTLKKAVDNGIMDELKSFELKRYIQTVLNSPKNNGNFGTIGEAFEEMLKADAKSNELLRIINDVEGILAIKGDYSTVAGLTGDELKRKLGDLARKHKNLGYKGARIVMFSDIDKRTDSVTCVYTGRKVKINMEINSGIPNASNKPNAAGVIQSMNTEHTWPKSLGAKKEPAKADLFHLFPTDTRSNGVRSSYDFGNVANGDATWEEGGSKFDGDVYMPRADHRGNVARAMFYFSIVYKLSIPSDEEKALRQWHKDDPVDATERKRNEAICKYQGNRNPFIDRADFVEKISNF